jgi:hypothetical protein
MQHLSKDMIPWILDVLTLALRATTRFGQAFPIPECITTFQTSGGDHDQLSLMGSHGTGNVGKMIAHFLFSDLESL